MLTVIDLSGEFKKKFRAYKTYLIMIQIDITPFIVLLEIIIMHFQMFIDIHHNPRTCIIQ